MKRLAVYCGSATPADPRYIELAADVGRSLARRGIGVVYGGGRLGLMGALASGALLAGGEVIGVIPEALAARELLHRGLTRTHVVGSMHERKALMESLSDAFVAMPGGFGTLDEIIEIITWMQLAIHAKPVGFLDVGGFWGRFVHMVDGLVETGFVAREMREALAFASDPDALLALMARSAIPPDRWGGAVATP